MLDSPHIPRHRLGGISLVSLLILLSWGLTVSRPSQRHVVPATVVQQLQGYSEWHSSEGVPSPTPAPLVGSYRVSSAGFELVAADGLLNEAQQTSLTSALDQALTYVVQRFGSGPRGIINTYIGSQPDCAIHGIAYTDLRTVQVFTCSDLPVSHAVNILAHEFVHQLCQDRYGEAHLHADLVLLEGVATWGAGDYWLNGAPDFRSFVRPWLQRGESLPLAQSYVGLPISDMNKLYYQWASFVEFLIKRYGRAQFDRLYVTGQGTPASADYLGSYGKDFAQLEQEWQDWVLGQ